jgi:alkylhydroperoxidase family enzyme
LVSIVFQIKIWAGVQTLVWKNQDKSWTPSQNIFLENYTRVNIAIALVLSQSDLDQIKALGYSNTQLIEEVAITGYFNYVNTLSNVFGLGK